VSPFIKSSMLTLEELDYFFSNDKLLSCGAYIALEKLFVKYNRIDLGYTEACNLAFGKVVMLDSYNGINREVALFLESDFIGLATVLPTGCLKVKKLRQSVTDRLCARN
ncbi:MAG: hypothetical protein HON55_00625, partial [Legionellales bacterium]|nr:hypothetical protein [Legionellales bacterium]